LEQVRELKKLYKNSINEQLVARQILAYALSERNIQFEEIQLLSKSKSIFSGDLFLTAKRPDGGLYLLLADFTGHGLSAAIGALPVADIFSVMTNKGFELEDILENINNKLYTLLPVSMFMACSVLKIDADLKHASVWNGGMPDIYVRNSQNGEIKNKIKSSHIPLGIDEATSDNFKLNTIAINHKDQFILYTDGLTEAENINGDMFGYQRLDKCLESNREKEFVFVNIVAEFFKFCGDIEPNDDVTLACIPCTENMTEVKESGRVNNLQITSNRDYECL
jgi:serine phosphatase RsbU (regulator of sigma subunit)